MNLLRLLVAVGATAVTADVAAQVSTSAFASKAAVAQLTFNSTFANYHPYAEPEVGDWYQLNALVRNSAGTQTHAGYAQRESGTETPQPRMPSSPATRGPVHAERTGQEHARHGGKR